VDEREGMKKLAPKRVGTKGICECDARLRVVLFPSFSFSFPLGILIVLPLFVFPMVLFHSFMVSCLLLTRNLSLFVPANHFSCFLLFCVSVKGEGEKVHVCVDVCMRRWMRCDGKKTTKGRDNNDRMYTNAYKPYRECALSPLVLPLVLLCFLIGFVIKPIAMMMWEEQEGKGTRE
jgi:hypothetical protein